MGGGRVFHAGPLVKLLLNGVGEISNSWKAGSGLNNAALYYWGSRHDALDIRLGEVVLGRQLVDQYGDVVLSAKL